MSIELINKEKEKYNDLFTELTFSVDDLKRMLDEEELRKRTFTKKLEVLTDYMNLLDDLETESNREKGFFKKLFKSNDIEEKIEAYLSQDKLFTMKKLEMCNKCVCKNCVSICEIEMCRNCMEKEFVKKCNKQDTVLIDSKDTVNLYQEDEKFVFNIAGCLVELDEELRHHRYLYLVDRNDYDNQHILKYYKYKGEECYDSVISDDDSVDELERLNDKFLEMGLNI